MTKDYQTTIRDIIHHITKQCMFSDISDFYVGISDDHEYSLFTEHNVNRKIGCWTYVEALNNQHAREAKKLLIGQGMEGDTDDDDSSGRIVYCYKITSETEE